jgi:endonuclease-3
MADGRKFPVQELLSRLEGAYGPPSPRERTDPLCELVSCILSQHTTDATSFPTFDHLREVMPSWEQVVEAGQERLADVIKRAGLANQKAKTIISCLEIIHARVGEYSLDFLADLPPLEARAWLISLPGVGPKTASIVLCFSFGMGVVPVDTHVFRVCQRLGVIPAKMDANEAHDALLSLVAQEDAFRFHMDLIVHGRRTCRAPVPSCPVCVVRDLCAWSKDGKRSK